MMGHDSHLIKRTDLLESVRPDALVVTSISPPNEILRSLAQGASKNGLHFYLIGDKKSPTDFQLDGCDYFSLKRQMDLPGKTIRLLPEGCYSRKNLGYLLAAMQGARLVVETDDDNFPLDGFWGQRARLTHTRIAPSVPWVNVYGCFGRPDTWPRGYPLELLGEQCDVGSLEEGVSDAPIQQALAADNPDVDAVFRLTRSLPVQFDASAPISLREGTWCPFNSQATFWFAEALALAYLPTYCSFRMTDIWRGFVAQRIAWTCSWSLRFESPLVRQDRNDHSLLKDFADEIPGYLNNAKICRALEGLDLRKGVESIPENMRRCYKSLVDNGWIGRDEMPLLEAWLEDLVGFTSTGHRLIGVT